MGKNQVSSLVHIDSVCSGVLKIYFYPACYLDVEHLILCLKNPSPVKLDQSSWIYAQMTLAFVKIGTCIIKLYQQKTSMIGNLQMS